MRTHPFTSPINAVLLVAVCATGAAATHRPNMAGQEDPAMQTIVTFRPDRVYEVTGLWLEDGRQDELNAYFAEVFPIAAADYGVVPLFGLEPVGAYAGDFTPDVMFVNEWPSLEHFHGFVNDPRAVALFPRRDAAVSRIVVTQYEVPAETTVVLRDGDVVEFGALWIKPGHEEALRTYYGKALEVAKRHGIRPITGLSPVYGYKGNYLPSRAALNLWGTRDRFDRFAAEAAPLFPERDATLRRLDVTHARVRLESAR